MFRAESDSSRITWHSWFVIDVIAAEFEEDFSLAAIVFCLQHCSACPEYFGIDYKQLIISV